ncbi:hypothetical protein B0O99DRAFT_600145 [Bisporella sp. PMI_857]|nr:hypothetical protein B0O99DRAFT_600145 [Bisporella sp. PMI_857]
MTVWLSVSGIGVGGSTLGNGYGYISTLGGFACDNVVEYEVVLANGTIVAAASTINNDLWKALKGGGSNLGIVTSFTFRTLPLGAIWAGDAYYTLVGGADELISAFYNFTANPDYDSSAALISSFAFGSTIEGQILLDIEYFYTRPVVNPNAFAEFFSLPDQLFNDTALTTLAAFSVQANAKSPGGSQQITFATMFENNLDMLHAAWDIYNASTGAVADVKGISWSLTLEPTVHAITAQSENGLVWTILSATFALEADYDIVSVAANQLLAAIIAAAKARGVYRAFVDMNHAGVGQNPIASYGKENEEHIQQEAKKYDPGRIFQTLMPGGFKIELLR